MVGKEQGINLYNELFTNQSIADAYSQAKIYLTNTINPYNPNDTYLAHSIRTANRLSEILKESKNHELMVIAALLSDVPKVADVKIKTITSQFEEGRIFYLVLGSNLFSNVADLSYRQRQEKLLRGLKNLGNKDLIEETKLLIAVSELDNLTSYINYFNYLQNIFGKNSQEIFLGSTKISYKDIVWFYHQLFSEVGLQSREEDSFPYWKTIEKELNEKLKTLENIFPEVLKEHKDKSLDMNQSQLKVFLDDLCKKKIVDIGADLIVAIPGGRVGQGTAIRTFDGKKKNIGDIDIILYQPSGKLINPSEENINKFANSLFNPLYCWFNENGVDWTGQLKILSVDHNEKKLIFNEKPLTFDDYLDGFDFNLTSDFSYEDVFKKILEFTLMIGNSRNKSVVSPKFLRENYGEIHNMLAESLVSQNPSKQLLTDSHLYIPYIIPYILNVLKKVNLYSNDGLKALILEALSNKGAWVQSLLSQSIEEKCPQGIFKSQNEAIRFLRYFVDNLRESLGKTDQTFDLYRKDLSKYQAIYCPPIETQQKVIEDLRRWFISVETQITDLTKVEFYKYRKKYQNLIFSAFLNNNK